MKALLTTVAVSFLATSAMAQDGLSFGGEIVGESNLSQEATSITVTPELVYGVSGFDLVASTDLTIYDNGLSFNTALDTIVIDLGVEYTLNNGVELSLGTSYDVDAQTRGDVIAKVSFAF
jgi:hypothetical protein